MPEQKLPRYREYGGYISRIIKNGDFSNAHQSSIFFESFVTPCEEMDEDPRLAAVPKLIRPQDTDIRLI